MQFSTKISLAIATICLSVSAVNALPSRTEVLDIADLGPVAVNGSALAERAVGGVTICTEVDFAGACVHLADPAGKCVGLPAPYLHAASSFRPDQLTTCVLYSDTNCKNVILDVIVNPGCQTLNDCDGNDINDRIGSYVCVHV